MKSNIRLFTALSAIILSAGIITSLTACDTMWESSEAAQSERIGPYELSQREEDLLQALGMDHNTQVLAFQAPRSTKSIAVHAYYMKDSTKWEALGGLSLLAGEDTMEEEALTGIFTMVLGENYSMDFNITSNGRASLQTEEIPMENNEMASLKGFMTTYQDIELNSEIPVAIMVYDSGSQLESYTLDDFNNPARFKGLDLVQAVTVTFLSEEEQ